MKRFLPIPLILVIFCSCTNRLDYQSDQPRQIVILNAQLRTDETQHAVWVFLGGLDHVFTPKDLRLECFVNGVPTGPVIQRDTSYDASPYYFEAVIRPGDEVRLEATVANLHASATVTAPQPAILAAVDTMSVTEYPYGSRYYGITGTALRCQLHLQDKPGEANWYRLCLDYDAEQQDRFPDHPDADRTLHVHQYASFLFDKDPVLNDGYPTFEEIRSRESVVNTAFSIYNQFCSFRDISFADGQTLTTLYVPSYQLRAYSYSPGFTPDGQVILPVRTIRHPRLKIRFLTLSQEEYTYLAALNRGQDLGYDWFFLTEPLIFPSNVEGGLGLVTVASASDITLEFPDFEVDE